MTVPWRGPVDDVVVELPPGSTTIPGELAAEVASLVENGIVRILDLAVVNRRPDGTLRVLDLDLDKVVELDGVWMPDLQAGARRDLAQLAGALGPGRSAAVIVWEHLWTAPFDAAARRAGGRLLSIGRVPPDALAQGA